MVLGGFGVTVVGCWCTVSLIHVVITDVTIVCCSGAVDLIHVFATEILASPRTSILSDPYPPVVGALTKVEAYLCEANGVDVGEGRRVIRSSHRAGSIL